MGIFCFVLALPPKMPDARSIFQGVLSKYEPESEAEAGVQQAWPPLVFPMIYLFP